jgi:hypothetical protein
MHFGCAFWAACAGLLALTQSRSLAFADETPTYFVVELNSGIAPPAYQPGTVGFTGGLTTGATFHLAPSPLRLALLASFAGRYARASSSVDGLSFDASRRDLDLYAAARLGVPIFSRLRAFGEIGYGWRFVDETIHRSAIGDVPSSWTEPLLVLAFGLELRLSQVFSCGLRVEMTPLSPNADAIPVVAHATPETPRSSFAGFVGFHF